MKDDVERELRQIENFIEELERSRDQDAGDEPDSSVPASLKATAPRPEPENGEKEL